VPVTGSGFSHREILVIMSGLMMGLFLASLDQTIVSGAPDDRRGLSPK
jgi:hypothetical protein